MNGQSSPTHATPAATVPATSASKRERGYLLAARCAWALALLLICVRVGWSPHKQSVFSADYLPAGAHWLRGEEIYNARHHFIYSPLAAAAFVPFAVLPAGPSGILWRLGCAAAFAWVCAAWLRSGLSNLRSETSSFAAAPPGYTNLGIAFLLLLPLAAGNLNLGQLNVGVLVLTAGSVLAARARRWNLAALLLAVGGFMKIYPLAVGLLLAMLYPRQLSWRLAVAVAALFLVSLGLQHPAYAWREYRQWFAVLGGDDRLDVDLYASWRDFGFLLRACGVPLSDSAYRLMEAGAGGLLAVFLWLGQHRWRWSEDRLLGAVFSLGCAWMVLFGPATEAATYVLLALPVCAALLAAWRRLPGAVGRQPGFNGFTAVFAASYALLLLADLANAWFHGWTHHLAMRALQPVAALVFTGGMVGWLMRKPAAESLPAELSIYEIKG